MTNEKRRKITRVLALLGGLLFLILLWWLLSFILETNGNYLLPSPWVTFRSLGTALFDQELAPITFTSLGWTFMRLVIGFAVSLFLGAFLGTLSGLFEGFGSFMTPSIVLMKAIPTVAVVLILTGLFFGRDYRAIAPYIPIFLAFLVMFPLIYESFSAGIRSVSKETREALSLDGAERHLSSVWKVYYPKAFPLIAVSFVSSLGLGLKVTIMSEVLIGNNVQNGLGELIREARDWLGMDYLLAYSILGVIVVGLVDLALHFLKKELKKRLDFGKEDSRTR